MSSSLLVSQVTHDDGEYCPRHRLSPFLAHSDLDDDPGCETICYEFEEAFLEVQGEAEEDDRRD